MARNVVVTGGSSGIGLAVAKRFAAAGDQVLITGRDLDRAETAAVEIGARAAQCDATSPADVEALVAAIDGQVDVLVNMAGGNTDFDYPRRRRADPAGRRRRHGRPTSRPTRSAPC